MDVTLVHTMDIGNQKPGGVDTYINELIKGSAVYGIDFKLVGMTDKSTKCSKTKIGCEFIPIIKKNKTSGYTFLLYLMLKAPIIKLSKNCIIDAQRPDYIFPFILSHKQNPKVCTLHGLNSTGIHLKKGKIIGKIYDLIEKFSLKRVDKVVAVDETTKKYYLKKYPFLEKKTEVIPLGIDINKFKPLDKKVMRQKHGFKKDDYIAMYVGRLEKEKNLDVLIRSFKFVNDSKLIIVGDGRERKRLERLTNEFNLSNVEFRGKIKHELIPEIMNCADVFVLTSLYESGPLVVQEALACGIPVISVNVGRVQEFIKNESIGRIVARDEKKIAENINFFKKTAKNQKTRKECRKVAKDFDFSNTAKKTIKVYLGLSLNKSER